jgi:hypothetical protein
MAEDEYPPANPSPLTTAALFREISHLKDSLTVRIDALQRESNLFREDIKRVPTEVQREVGNLKELHEEKIKGVAKQLVDYKQVGADALAAALQTTKELTAAQDVANATALEKSQKTIDQRLSDLAKLLESRVDAMRTELATLKSRLDTGEGGSGAVREHTADRRLDTGLIVAVFSVLVAAAAIAVALIK